MFIGKVYDEANGRLKSSTDRMRVHYLSPTLAVQAA